ncbi:MAG TPA: sensor domain-containing diguanylate cyclase [Planctomycetota bacterium]|nr:sensor domain-containing diguanylate cyclase [Planctomycetota bacterium]
MIPEVYKQIREGHYDAALKLAKRLSIDYLKEGRQQQAAHALAGAAHIQCLLNSPSKAKSFAQEAYELSARVKDTLSAGYALAVGALAQLRLAEFDQADSLIDKALEALNRHSGHEVTAFAHLVSAELSITQEDYAEARVFAEDAYQAAAKLGASALKARAGLVKAICAERSGDMNGAIELLNAAEQELLRQPDAETQWLIKAAMANACFKSGKEQAGQTYRQAAVAAINRIANELSDDVRDRYLKNPAVVNALGVDTMTNSGMWKVPVQITSTASERKATTTDLGLNSIKPVLEVIKKINTELNLRKLITMILDTAIEFCNAQRGTIVVFEGEKFKIELSRDREKNELKRLEMGVSRTVLKLVRDSGKRVIAEDARQDPTLKIIDSVQDQSLLSILCVPLRVKLRLIGAVYLDNSMVVGAFGPREIEIAEILTDHAAVAIDNALLHIKAIHDTLTNLFNHGHFEKRLDSEVARGRRHGRPCGVLMMDIDDFKKINDTYGHDAGNEILKSVSRVLATTMRTDDLVARRGEERDAAPVVARYGGDEFEIILPETSRDGVQRAAERILEAVRNGEFRYGEHSIQLAFSIGGAVYPEDAGDARELLLRADEALYAAKRAGKNRVVLASPKPASPSK